MTTTVELPTFTVIGLWIDDKPLVAGVVEGEHMMADSEWGSDGFSRWATSVQAEDAECAESYAVAEMRGQEDDEDEYDHSRTREDARNEAFDGGEPSQHEGVQA
ncbi:hypothetical protein ALI22I_33825 [Saccharothrix sp. ALI-22-I]|uniref:hypothetical protein n=1 Tax=Saccharothrix sp. ALI-22-I TaxID=1933778 RepID=UPI00097C7536|nr:hypothetical protein [Saccharothrix sp. ALI-22-I]ONI83479.1 hypothetical protein ALI22I_33825 [Saccharothrix sp. ALI-22-I]